MIDLLLQVTDKPLGFGNTGSTSIVGNYRQQPEMSSSYTSEQLRYEQERHSSTQTTTSATTVARTTQDANVVASFPSHVGSVEQQKRPQPAPVQPPVTPITNTTSIINNYNTTHHTTSTSFFNNNSSSSSSVLQQAVVVPSPLPSGVGQSSGTVEISSTFVQDVATAAASAAAAQVASVYGASWRENERQTKEAQEEIRKELQELRIREEKAAFEQKEKSDKDERERRVLRTEIELKEKQEAELRVKREREERAAKALKQKLEWEAVEGAKDQAARLARAKQDEERDQRIRSDEERKYREWSRLQTLQREQRQRESDEQFEKTRKEEEVKARQVKAQAVIQEDAESAKGIEAEEWVKLEPELPAKSSEKDANKTRSIETREPEVGPRGVQELAQNRVQGENVHEKPQQDSTTILREQDQSSHQSKALGQDYRNSEVGKRQAEATEMKEVEIIQEHQTTAERLPRLNQIVVGAYQAKDESKVQEVQRLNRVEKERDGRLGAEPGRSVVVQEDVRIRERGGQVKADGALIEDQHMVVESNTRQFGEKGQQNDAQLLARIGESRLKIEEQDRVILQMEQIGQKDVKAGGLIAQVVEDDTEVRVGRVKTSRAGTDLVKRQEESGKMTEQAAAGHHQVMSGGIEKVQIIAAVGAHTHEAVQVQTTAEEQKIEDQSQEEWQHISEEDRMINAEVQRRRGLEREGEKLSELEKKAAELQRLIAAAAEAAVAEKETRRARRQARRDDPGYKEREARRSRERSKVRETETEKARREEIEFVRKNAGLDKRKERKRYNVADRLPTQDIPGFVEGSWTVPFGVPTLIQTPPSPPPGTLKYPNVLHCEGSYFPEVASQLPQDYVVSPDIFMVQPITTSHGIRQVVSAGVEGGMEGLAEFSRSTGGSSGFENRMDKSSSQSLKDMQTTEQATAGTSLKPARSAKSSSEFERRMDESSLSSRDVHAAAQTITGASLKSSQSAETFSEVEHRMEKSSSQSSRDVQTAAQTIAETSLGSRGVETSSEFEHRMEKSSQSSRAAAKMIAEASLKSSRSVETSSEFEHRMNKSSSQSSSDVQTATKTTTGTSLIATGNPFMGTPVAPVPTVAPGFNIGAKVIKEGNSNQFGRVDTQHKNESQGSQGLVCDGPELPGFNFGEPVSKVGAARTTNLLGNTVSQPSSAVYEIVAISDSPSRSSHGGTSLDYSRQPKASEVACGSELPPAETPHQSTYGTESSVSSHKRSEPEHKHTSPDYSRQLEASEAACGSELRPTQTSHQSTYGVVATVTSDHPSGSSTSSTYNHDQKSSAVGSEVQTSHQSISGEGTQSFHIPRFDEQAVVTKGSSRENQTSTGV